MVVAAGAGSSSHIKILQTWDGILQTIFFRVFANFQFLNLDFVLEPKMFFFLEKYRMKMFVCFEYQKHFLCGNKIILKGIYKNKENLWQN